MCRGPRRLARSGRLCGPGSRRREGEGVRERPWGPDRAWTLGGSAAGPLGSHTAGAACGSAPESS